MIDQGTYQTESYFQEYSIRIEPLPLELGMRDTKGRVETSRIAYSLIEKYPLDPVVACKGKMLNRQNRLKSQ
jgi:hypothetical protein